MIDQRRDRRILLLLRRQLERRIAISGRYGQQRGKQRRDLLDVAMSGCDRGLQARQRQRGRILAVEAEREFELLGERIERGGRVVGRALERDLSVAVARDPLENLLDDARLADTGLAELDHDLAIAVLGLLPAPHQQRDLLLAVDERGQPRAHRGGEAGLHPRGAHHVPSLRLIRDALQRMDAEIAVVELPLQQRLGRGGNHHAVGRRQALQARGEIDGFSDRGVALFGALSHEIADHDETGRDPDADGGRVAERATRLDRASGRQHPHDLEPRTHRALGVVLMCGRIAEIDQNTVADEPGGKTLVMLDHADAGLAEARDHVAHVFRIELRRERGGIHHVAEHGGELAPFGSDLHPGRRRCRRGGRLRRFSPEQRRHRPLEPLAIAKRQSELDQVGFGQIPHDIEIEAVLREEIGIVRKADTFEPALQPAIRFRARLILQHGDSAQPSLRRRALGPSTTDFGARTSPQTGRIP